MWVKMSWLNAGYFLSYRFIAQLPAPTGKELTASEADSEQSQIQKKKDWMGLRCTQEYTSIILTVYMPEGLDNQLYMYSLYMYI